MYEIYVADNPYTLSPCLLFVRNCQAICVPQSVWRHEFHEDLTYDSVAGRLTVDTIFDLGRMVGFARALGEVSYFSLKNSVNIAVFNELFPDRRRVPFVSEEERSMCK